MTEQTTYRVVVKWRKLPNRRKAALNCYVTDTKAHDGESAILAVVTEFKHAKRRAHVVAVEAEVVYP